MFFLGFFWVFLAMLLYLSQISQSFSITVYTCTTMKVWRHWPDGWIPDVRLDADLCFAGKDEEELLLRRVHHEGHRRHLPHQFHQTHVYTDHCSKKLDSFINNNITIWSLQIGPAFCYSHHKIWLVKLRPWGRNRPADFGSELSWHWPPDHIGKKWQHLHF